MRRRLPALLLLPLLGAATARADGPAAPTGEAAGGGAPSVRGRIGFVVTHGDAAHEGELRAIAGETLRARGDRLAASATDEAEALPPRGVEPGDLEALGRLEALLLEARAASAELDEAGALRRLAAAGREARALLHVEGTAAWLAEVEMRTGAVAAQVGMTALAEDAFRRAYRLDPTRTLRPGEASPEVVTLAEAVARRVDAGPRATLDVRCADPRAVVSIDDRAAVACPVRVELPIGAHAVRVSAPGRRAYGALIDLAQGERAPVEIALAPDELVLAARAFDRGSASRAVADWPRALAALAEAGLEAEVMYVEVGARPRGLAVRCEAGGCSEPTRLEPGTAPSPSALADRTGAEAERALEADASYLSAGESASPPSDAEPHRKRRIALITAAFVGAAGLAAGLAVALAPEPRDRLEVVVHPP